MEGDGMGMDGGVQVEGGQWEWWGIWGGVRGKRDGGGWGGSGDGDGWGGSWGAESNGNRERFGGGSGVRWVEGDGEGEMGRLREGGVMGRSR